MNPVENRSTEKKQQLIQNLEKSKAKLEDELLKIKNDLQKSTIILLAIGLGIYVLKTLLLNKKKKKQQLSNKKEMTDSLVSPIKIILKKELSKLFFRYIRNRFLSLIDRRQTR